MLVRLDTKSCALSCKCDVKHRLCTHKKLVLWFLSEHDPTILGALDSMPSTDSDSLSTNRPSSPLQSVVDYTCYKNSIPVDIKPVMVDSSIVELVPEQNACPSCDSQLKVAVDRQSCPIYDMEKVVKGNPSSSLINKNSYICAN